MTAEPAEKSYHDLTDIMHRRKEMIVKRRSRIWRKIPVESLPDGPRYGVLSFWQICLG